MRTRALVVALSACTAVIVAVLPAAAVPTTGDAGLIAVAMRLGSATSQCSSSDLSPSITTPPTEQNLPLSGVWKLDTTSPWSLFSSALLPAGYLYSPVGGQGELHACGQYASTQEGPCVLRGDSGYGRIQFGGLEVRLVDVGWVRSVGGSTVVTATTLDQGGQPSGYFLAALAHHEPYYCAFAFHAGAYTFAH